jgi:putative ABC transport system permease protein
MQALWHLAINSLAGRRGRTALLVLAVALATVLTVAVASAIGTISRSVGHVVGRVAGLADVYVRHRFGGRLPQSLLDEVRSWPEVALAAGRVAGGASLRSKRTGRKSTALLRGLEPRLEAQLRPRDFLAGRAVRSDGEIALCPRLRRELDANVGDVLEVVRLGGTDELTVVGIFQRPRLAVLQRPTALARLAQAQTLIGQTGQLDEIRIRLRDGVSAEALVESRKAGLPPGAVLRTPVSLRAGVNRRLRFANLMLYVLTVLTSLSAGFLILTSLTTAATQQAREMAILRCIGASRSQLAAAQLAAGSLIALLGAAIGTPAGLLGAYALYRRFHDALPGGFAANPTGVAAAVAGSLLAGLLGASYPAFLAATARPLEALTVRARPPKRRHVALCAAAGLALAAAQPVLMSLPIPVESLLWLWTYFGLPATFLGCFLLSVPLLALIARTAAPLLGRLLRLPGALLGQSVLATPMRHGFAGGTLMVSLALLVAIWTQGRGVMVGWFQTLRMPDAFVHRFPSLTEEQWQAMGKVQAATRVCPTTTFAVRAVGVQFGIPTISPPKTLFVATDMTSFLQMTELTWYEGDRQAALRRVAGGAALLVSREWSVAHGVGVGGTLGLETLEGPVDFEVVGVVGSAGLDMAKHFFGIRRRFSDASLSSVFGTRDDAKRYFNVRGVNLVLVSLRDDVSDKEALRQLTEAAPGSVAGTSRQILRHVRRSLDRLMAVASALAFGSLLIACLGVANLIVAEVASRRFEFGVLRAIGAQRSLIGRLVAGQTLIVALVGCAAGTMLGTELALIERGFQRRLVGIEYAAHLPGDVIAGGALAVVAAALIAAVPAIWGLMRRPPRALFARRE